MGIYPQQTKKGNMMRRFSGDNIDIDIVIEELLHGGGAVAISGLFSKQDVAAGARNCHDPFRPG